MRRTLLAVLALLFAGLAFVPGLNGPFIHDDAANLSLVMRQVASWPEALDVILSNGSGALHRPISNASFLANYLLAGESAFAFKLVNLGLHLTCGGLAYLLMTVLMPCIAPRVGERHRTALSLVIAMAWAAHPLQVSTVLYVVQRMTILGALFTLGALVLASRQLLDATQPARRDAPMVIGYFALAALAVLSKESGALIPLFLAAIVLVAASTLGTAIYAGKRWLIWICCGAPIAIGLIGLVLGWDYLANGYASRPFGMADRTATEIVILWRYLAHIVIPLPSGMHFFWDDTEVLTWSDPQVWIGILAWAALLGLAVIVRRRFPALLFALLWYWAGHAMESTLIPLELAYEHRNYLPSLGPIAAACILIHAGLARNEALVRPIALAAIGILMVLTAGRAFTWSSLPRLIAHETEVQPDSVRAQFNAINVSIAQHDWNQAGAHLQRIRQLSPSEAWVEMIPLTMACLGGPPLVSPETTRQLLVENAADIRVSRGVPQLVDLEIQTHCLTDRRFPLEQILIEMGNQARLAHEPTLAADYFYQSAWLSYSRGDLEAATTGLKKAVATAPDQDAPLERLFDVQLMRGDRAGAEHTLSQLEHVWETGFPLKRYKLIKLRRELGTIR